MQDEAIHAFTPLPSSPAPARQAPRRRWWLAALMLFFALLVLATTLVLLGLLDGAREGLTFWVDGEPWRLSSTGDWDIGTHTVAGALLAATLLVVALPLALLSVCLCVVLVFVLSLVAAAGGLALGLGAVLLVLAVALAPLWGFGLLLWLLVRRQRKPAPLAGS